MLTQLQSDMYEEFVYSIAGEPDVRNPFTARALTGRFLPQVYRVSTFNIVSSHVGPTACVQRMHGMRRVTFFVIATGSVEMSSEF